MKIIPQVSLPNQWKAREYQAELWRYMIKDGYNAPGKLAACVWHRRAGKDSFSLNFGCVMAHQRKGTYWHMLPTLQQARRVVWDGIDKDGRRMIDQAFPEEIRKSINNSEMKIELKCGSIWQCVGSDNYNALVGTNPVGVVFSEYSVADPLAWEYLRPILVENGGWAIFIYTFRGKNHGYRLAKMAEDNEKWFYSLKTIDDTVRDDGTSVISKEAYQEEINSGMDPILARQEYYCSPDAGLQGAYYTEQMNLAEKEGRIGEYPHIQNRTVTTIWDLGIMDDNFILYVQNDGEYARIIDCDYGPGKSTTDWIREVNRKPYIYDYHWAPHDIENREGFTGKTRKEQAASLGFWFDVVPKISVMDGIDSVRMFFGIFRYNKSNCGNIIDCLTSYIIEYEQKMNIFKQKPLHDWASHGSDATRYASIVWEEGMSREIFPGTTGNIIETNTPKVLRSVA